MNAAIPSAESSSHARYAYPMTVSAPERPRLRIVDMVVGILLGLIALGVAFAFYTVFFTLRDPAGSIATSCAASGAVCDQNFLNTICYIGFAVCLFGFALPIGFMIVRFLQRRRAWFLPLIAIAVIIVGFYVLLFILGRGYGV